MRIGSDLLLLYNRLLVFFWLFLLLFFNLHLCILLHLRCGRWFIINRYLLHGLGLSLSLPLSFGNFFLVINLRNLLSLILLLVILLHDLLLVLLRVFNRLLIFLLWEMFLLLLLVFVNLFLLTLVLESLQIQIVTVRKN